MAIGYMALMRGLRIHPHLFLRVIASDVLREHRARQCRREDQRGNAEKFGSHHVFFSIVVKRKAQRGSEESLPDVPSIAAWIRRTCCCTHAAQGQPSAMADVPNLPRGLIKPM
jgi:hypothetical protein